MALLLGLIPLLYPGLFFTSTDMLPKRLFLYLSGALLCLIWLIQHATDSRHSLNTPLTKIATIYVAWNMASLFWATNAFTGWVEALQLLVVFIIFIATTTLNIRQHIQTIGFVATIGGLIVSLIGIAQYLGLGFDTMPSVGLPSSTFIFRNLAAAYLLGAIPLGVLAVFHLKTAYSKNICFLSLSCMLLYLFYTRTRGAWVALAGSVFIFALLIFRFPSLRTTVKNQLLNTWHTPSNRWIGIFSIAVLIIGITLPSQTSKNVIQQFDEQKATPTTAVTSLLTPGSDRGRFTMWRHTGSMIADHPLVGVGLDNWEYIYPLYDRGEKITFSSEPVRPHNDMLWIASELGIIGLCMYLALLFFAVQRVYLTLRQNDTPLSLLLVMALFGLTSLTFYGLFSFPKEQPTPTLFFWFYLGLINLTPPLQTQKRQILIPLAGLIICLSATYMCIRHIQFDQHYQIARAYESQQKWAQADQAIIQALEKGVFDHRAQFLHGHYLQKMGKFAASATVYLDALKTHPHYAHTHHNLGGVYAARGNLQQAIPSFKRALEIRPNYHQASLHLGNAYVATHQYDLARKVFQDILKNNPHSADAYTNLGAVYLRQEKFGLAIQAFRKALEIHPQSAQAYNNLAYAYEQIGQITNAITAYENLLKHWKGESEYRTTIKNHLMQLRQQLETP